MDDQINLLEKDFYRKVEEPGYLKHILYGDTDSIIFKIPTKNTEQLELSELWDRAEITAENINKLIIDYTKNILLPRSNINPERNQTFFKTELLMESILLLDVKKKYAYKLLIKEGKILNPPKISYTGIEVIKSNGIKITQEMLKKIIEDIALEVKLNLTEKKENTVKTIEIFYNNFIEAVNSFNFEYIGIPGKWSKDKQIINGMKLYNHIMNEHIFEQSSSGRFLYIKSVNIGAFKNSVGICIPYSFNIDILREKFKIFNIEIDVKTQWSKIFNTTCERVIKIIKSVN
jgi:DNA polymerase elongation subunit (family B)